MLYARNNLLAAGISCLLYILIHPSMVHVATYPATNLPTDHVGYFQYIAHLIPTTIFSPFLEQQVISVLFLGILVGIAISFYTR